MSQTQSPSSKIQQIYKALQKLDVFIQNPQIPDLNNQILAIKHRLEMLKGSSNQTWQELSRLSGILTPDITPRQMQTVLVAFERELKRSVRDDQIGSTTKTFSITTQDRVLSTQTPNGPTRGLTSDQTINQNFATSENQRTVYPLSIILDHWRSAFNVGSILRTADGLGLNKIYLTGYTPLPSDIPVQKTALGADQVIPWEHHLKTDELILKLKSNNKRIIAFETSPQAKELSEPFDDTETVFLFGNERFGLDANLIELCDEIRALPMKGIKNSLNVSVMAAIAGYEWIQQYETLRKKDNQ